MHKADQIWYNGNIETMDPATPRAQAIAVTDGRIIAVGADSDVLNLAGPDTVQHNLDRQFLMPGLVESHTHALWGACRELFDVYTGFGATLDELLSAVKQRADLTTPGDVVHGGPWRHDMREQMGENPRALLDNISDVHPIVLADTSQHILWCNSVALQQAGIGANTVAPPGGIIERHQATNLPNGILAESAAAPARKLIKRSDAQMADAARYFVRHFNQLGFTAFKEPMAYEDELKTYLATDSRGELTIHTATHIVRSSPLGEDAVPYETMERLRRDYASDNIRTGFAKLFLDGVAPGYTASFLQPYTASSGYNTAAHKPDDTLLLKPDELNDTVCELDRRGFVVKMHAVGDNAIRKGLDAIEAARITNGASGLRHEIAHTNYVSDADLPRFHKLNAIAEMSPKMWFPNPATPTQIALLGKDRVARNHRIADLLAAGAELTYASDWPAAAPDVNPWTGLSGMLTRRNADPAYPGVLSPEQAITLKQALPIFTRNGARSLGMGDTTGCLKTGYWGDFIVLKQSIHDMAAEEIAAIEVQQTIWKGRVVYTA